MPVTTAAVAMMNSCPLQERQGLMFPFACTLASKNKANIPVITRHYHLMTEGKELLDFAQSRLRNNVSSCSSPRATEFC